MINNVKPNIEGKSKKDTKTWMEFRNAVIHKGYIPSMAEVSIYGDVVYKYIYKLIDDLKSNSSEYVQKVTFHHLIRAHHTAEGKLVTTLGIPTLISLNLKDRPADTFEEALDGLRKYKRWLYH